MKKLLVLLLLAAASLPAARFDLSSPGKIVRLSDPQISPDGKSVAVVVTRSNFAENRNDAEIVLVEISTKAQRVLTHGRRGSSSPRWSPDGSRLAYLAAVDGKAQIHVLPMGGGESEQVTKSPTGVQNFSWRPDGKALAFSAFDEEPKREGEERFNRAFEVQNNHFLTQEAPRPSHLWLVMADGGSPARRLTSGSPNDNWTLPVAFPPGAPPPPPSWSADGKSIAIVKVATVYSGDSDRSTIEIVDAESGNRRALTSRKRQEGHPEISPDASRVAYAFPRDGQAKNGAEIYVAPLSGGEGKSVTTALDRNILRAIWMPDSKSLLVAANDHTSTGLWIQPLEGAARRIDAGKVVAGGGFGLDASVSRDGRIALTGSEPLRPSELYWLAPASAKPERLTDFNAQIAALELGRAETIEWDGPDGFGEDGVVTYPPDFQPGRKYPLVLYIHGGPRSASKEAFSSRSQLMAAQGWLVFEPNYRGSDNLGNAYQAAIWNDAGAGPGRDVISGLEALKRRGIVDESRMAVSGWSYGGYMTTWLMGNYPNLWKVAVSGAAVTDWLDQYNLGDANQRRGTAFGGSPYTDPKRTQAYAEQSPITYAPKMRTTLILALTGDYRVPPTQSYRLYHALRDNGVPVKFFAYPLTGHNPADPVHQRDVDRRWIDWLRAFLESGH